MDEVNEALFRLEEACEDYDIIIPPGIFDARDILESNLEEFTMALVTKTKAIDTVNKLREMRAAGKTDAEIATAFGVMKKDIRAMRKNHGVA